jgi:hypothetical protein
MFPIVYSSSKVIPTVPFYLFCLFTVSGLSEGLASGLSDWERNDTPTMITRSFVDLKYVRKYEVTFQMQVPTSVVWFFEYLKNCQFWFSEKSSKSENCWFWLF